MNQYTKNVETKLSDSSLVKNLEDFYSKTALQQLKDYLNIIDSFLYEKRLRNMEKVNTLPTHYEYLKENIYNGEE